MFPDTFDVKATREDTVTGFKELLFIAAEERGFNMEGIDPDSVFIAFWDADEEEAKMYNGFVKLAKIRPTPTLAFLRGYLQVNSFGAWAIL